MMWWAVLCAVLVASAGAAAAPSRETLEQLEPYDLVQIEPRPPAPEDTDSDLVSFGISPSGDRFMPNNPWHTHGEPREVKDLISYGLSPSGDRFMPNNPWHTHGEPREAKRQTEGRSRPKRKMPSLSINNPMEVLRQRLMLEVARKQMREASQRQAVANRVFLQNVGKRGFWQNSEYSQYDN